MQYGLVFLEGIITFISPCLLPMLPMYISFFAAGGNSWRRTFFRALGFMLGFTVVFVVLGAFAGTLGGLLVRHAQLLNIIAGIIVILFGLNYVGVLRVGILNRTAHVDIGSGKSSFFQSVLFGIVFAVGWTPCVGAFLGSALLLASSTGTALQGILMLFIFSLGLGLPFLASALLIDQLKGAFDFIKRNYKIINIISGALLILLGILLATGFMGRWLALQSF